MGVKMFIIGFWENFFLFLRWSYWKFLFFLLDMNVGVYGFYCCLWLVYKYERIGFRRKYVV